MASVCLQCGATFNGDETCEGWFTAGQVKEGDDPAYCAVHHLSVASHMLQHNAYSREGWLITRDLLAQFIAGLTPQEARRRMRHTMDSGNRSFSLTRGPKLDGVEDIAWMRTVADVRLDTAEHYCADVREWATSVLADSAGLVDSSKGRDLQRPR
jgi:hypothetical protein